MPRTKRPAAKKEKPVEDIEALKLDRFLTEQKNQIDLLMRTKCRDIELAFKILVESLGPDVLQRTVGEVKGELDLKEVTNTRRTRNSTTTTRSASQDDGYLTEGSSHGSGGRRTAGKRTMGGPPTTVGRATGRRSRSADARKGMQTITKTAQRIRSKSVYKTPAYNRSAGTNFPPITPKVAPNMPLTVLRQPRQGEMVVSMSGSPVMVPTYNNMQQSEKANCNIMLEDGTMLSLQPRALRQSSAYIPFSLMDASVLAQLKMLRNNLETVVRMGERAHDKSSQNRQQKMTRTALRLY